MPSHWPCNCSELNFAKIIFIVKQFTIYPPLQLNENLLPQKCSDCLKNTLGEILNFIHLVIMFQWRLSLAEPETSAGKRSYRRRQTAGNRYSWKPPFYHGKKNLGTAYKVVSTILLVPLSLVENLRNSNFLAIFLIYVLSNPEFPVLKEIQRFEWSEFQSKTISKRMFGKISSFESSYETHPRSQFSQENKRSHAIWRMLNFHFHISIMAAR